MTINLNGIYIDVERKPVKYLRLCVTADGAVRLTVPNSAPERVIKEFINSRADWIAKQRIRAEKLAIERAAFDKKAAKSCLKKIIETRLPYYETLTGLKCSSYTFRDMKSRWGTCNAKTGKLCFSLRLASKPPGCVDYIIVHELIHLAVHNHGKDFKALMDKFYPGWRRVKKLLRE